MRVHTGILFPSKICKENDIGKMADLIEIPGSVSGVGPRNRVLDGPAYWRHLVNTVERFKDWLYLYHGTLSWKTDPGNFVKIADGPVHNWPPTPSGLLTLVLQWYWGRGK